MSRPSVLSTDSAHRRLCHDLFDAIEAGDIDAVSATFAPDMTMWFNVTGAETSRADTLDGLVHGATIQRRRTYNDRQIHTFDDGFVAQYVLNVVLHDGSAATLWACLVATVHDGLIVRLDEYLDSTKFVPRGGRIGRPRTGAES